MARVLVIDGHPSPDRDRFVHALANAYRHGAEELHEVRQVVIADLDFPILRDPKDWIEGDLPAILREAQDAMAWATHIVLVFPLWLGGMPGLLKAFLEQVARPGFAIETRPDGTWRKLLKAKSARIIVTMGMPAPVYRYVFRAHSLRSLKRNILHFVGIRPVRTTIIGQVDRSDAYRKRWLRRVERLGRFAR
jgi:putative NADPH-quinone reductase